MTTASSEQAAPLLFGCLLAIVSCGPKHGPAAVGVEIQNTVEPVEVPTPDLIQEIVAGGRPIDSFLDPELGFLELKAVPGAGDVPEPIIRKRHCGHDAGKVALEYLDLVVTLEAWWTDEAPDESIHVIACSTEHLIDADPQFGATYEDDGLTGGTPFRYAICESPGMGEYEESYAIYFGPDAELESGLRLIGVDVSEVGDIVSDHRWFASEALETGARCLARRARVR